MVKPGYTQPCLIILIPALNSMIATTTINMPLILLCFCFGNNWMALFAPLSTICVPTISAAETASPFIVMALDFNW